MARSDTAAPSKRGRGKPPHVPTTVDRDTVRIMVAGGIGQADIARARGISERTLRNYYKDEIDSGATILNTMVMIEWIKRIKAGDFAAIKWWTQARMGFSEKITVDDPARDQPLRVVVELVGQALPAGPVLDHEARLRGLDGPAGPRLPGTVVQLKG